jgi:glycosyltransferase involved in cell wall biosynthesis
MINVKISVVIPMTRYDKELDEALASVFLQSFQDFEVVLVDNHATDSTLNVANEWKDKNPERIRIVREENKGAVSARNRGILESRGEYIALLDSYDLMRPDRLKMQLSMIENNKDVSFVGSWFDEISPDGKNIVGRNNKPSIPRWGKLLFDKTPRWMSDPFYEPLTSTFFFRASDALRIGMFDRKFDPIWQEDTDFAFRMYEIGQVAVVPQALVEYRIHTPSDGIRRIFDVGVIVNHDVLFSKLREKYYQKGNSDSRSRFEKLKSRWLRESGIKLLTYKDGEEVGKLLIWKSFKSNPLDLKNWESVVRMNLLRPFYPRAFGIKGPIDAPLPSFVSAEWAKNLFSLE